MQKSNCHSNLTATLKLHLEDKDRLTADRYSKTKVLSGLARLCSGVTYAPQWTCATTDHVIGTTEGLGDVLSHVLKASIDTEVAAMSNHSPSAIRLNRPRMLERRKM